MRALDRLRLLEEVLENPEMMATLADLRETFVEAAMRADGSEVREAARLKALAIEDVTAAIHARMAGYRAEVELEGSDHG